MALSSGLPSRTAGTFPSNETIRRYNSVVWPSRSEVAMFQRNRKTEAVDFIINLALGGFLVLSPWLFDSNRNSDGIHPGWPATPSA